MVFGPLLKERLDSSDFDKPTRKPTSAEIFNQLKPTFENNVFIRVDVFLSDLDQLL